MSTGKRAYVPVPINVGPVDYPVIDLPISAFERGTAVVHTGAGDVAITAIYHRFYCRGTSQALLAMGMIATSWLPGQTGNNKTRQTILFDEEGRRCLVVGRKDRRSGMHELDIRRSGREFCVAIAMTDAQRKAHDQHRADQEAAAEKAKFHAAMQQLEPMSPVQAKRSLRQGIEGWLRSLKAWQQATQETTGCVLSDESTCRIHAALEALRNAYAGASMVRPVRHYERAGNVLFWPKT
jgi:hypothetical protein